jgi:hypothetical protein
MLRKSTEIEELETELGVRDDKGIKGLRDTLREIDEKISENKSTD